MVKKITHLRTSSRFDLANFPVTETIKMLTCLLEKIIKANDAIVMKQEEYSCFQSRSKPSIDIQSYLTRILKYCPCANECFLSLLVYFDRMSLQAIKQLRIDSLNIHRLIISGIMISSKFFSDVFFTNARYAKVSFYISFFSAIIKFLKKVGGLPVKELNSLELEFLSINNYNIYISLEELQQYGDQLLMHAIREREYLDLEQHQVLKYLY